MKKNNIVLAINTSTDCLGVALWNAETDEKHVFAEKVFRNQSSMLHPIMEDILSKNEVSMSDIGLAVCTKGPGSFTGVRIGLSAAQGFAFAANVPLVGISTLEAMAPQNEASTVWLGAIRGEVYVQEFDENSQALSQASVLPIEDAAKNLQHGHLLCTHGEISFPENMPEAIIRNISVDPVYLAKLGYADYKQNGETVINPIYLSQLKYRKKNAV